MTATLGRLLRPIRLDQPAPTSLARGGLLSTVGLLAQGVLRFATALLVGHIAGKEELGVVASAIAVATVLALLWPTTTGSAASKFLAGARGADDTAGLAAIAAHLRKRTVQSALLLGVASAGFWVLVDGGSWQGALSVAALTIAYSGYSFTRGVQFGAGQVQRATAWDLISVALGLGGLVALLLTGVRGPALVLPLVLTYGVYTLAGWPFGLSGRTDRRRELDSFVLLGAVGTLASTGFLQLSQITAKLVDGDEGAGLYAAALNLATPASMLAASLTLVLLPSLAEAWGRRDEAEFHAKTDAATRALAVLMVAVFGSIIVGSRLLESLVWGEQYRGVADVLPVLVLAVLATNLGVASVNALITRSRRGMVVTTGASVLGMAVGVAAWLLLVPGLGLVGVALGYLCGTTTIAGIAVVVAWRAGGHRWGWVFGRVALGLLGVGGLVLAQRLADLPVYLDPALVLAFLLLWGLLNRADIAKLPLPRRKR